MVSAQDGVHEVVVGAGLGRQLANFHQFLPRVVVPQIIHRVVVHAPHQQRALAAIEAHVLCRRRRRVAHVRKAADGPVLEPRADGHVHVHVEVVAVLVGHHRADSQPGGIHHAVHQVAAPVDQLPATRKLRVLSPLAPLLPVPAVVLQAGHELDAANGAGLDLLVDVAVGRRVVPLVGHHQDRPGPVAASQRLLALRHRADQRLFRHHVASGVQRVHDLLKVQRVRRPDFDGDWSGLAQ